MRIIDLLNKIANGEEVPKKFKYDGYVIEQNEIGYCQDNEGDYFVDSICRNFSNLIDEIEIIEEDKKIERVDRELDNDGYLSKKLNEIIDKINDLKEK